MRHQHVADRPALAIPVRRWDPPEDHEALRLLEHEPGPRAEHPCGKAHAALREAGHDPEVVKVKGIGFLPGPFRSTEGRREVERLTGSHMVPVLVTDDGEAINESDRIVAWARAHPAAAPAPVA